MSVESLERPILAIDAQNAMTLGLDTLPSGIETLQEVLGRVRTVPLDVASGESTTAQLPHATKGIAKSAGLPEGMQDDAVLCTSEIAGNVPKHTGQPLTMAQAGVDKPTETFWITIFDGSPDIPELPEDPSALFTFDLGGEEEPEGATATGKRGLGLVMLYADRFGYGALLGEVVRPPDGSEAVDREPVRAVIGKVAFIGFSIPRDSAVPAAAKAS